MSSPKSLETLLSDPAPFRILFVCTGNTCRSPLAEALAKEALAELTSGRIGEESSWEPVDIRSAGVAAFDGSPASEGTLEVADRHGLALRGHRSTVLTEQVVAEANLILTMSHSHLARVLELGGAERAWLLSDYVFGGEEGVGQGIGDPFGGGAEVYEDTYGELEILIGALVKKLEPMVAS